MLSLPWCVYLLKCNDGSFYIGITNNLTKRLKAHNAGKGAKYTRARRPCELINKIRCGSRSDAAKLEYLLKQRTHAEKLKIFSVGNL